MYCKLRIGREYKVENIDMVALISQMTSLQCNMVLDSFLQLNCSLITVSTLGRGGGYYSVLWSTCRCLTAYSLLHNSEKLGIVYQLQLLFILTYTNKQVMVVQNFAFRQKFQFHRQNYGSLLNFKLSSTFKTATRDKFTNRQYEALCTVPCEQHTKRWNWTFRELLLPG